jgi:hypothetical protein
MPNDADVNGPPDVPRNVATACLRRKDAREYSSTGIARRRPAHDPKSASRRRNPYSATGISAS